MLPSSLTVRIGCKLVYETPQPTPIFLVVTPRPENGQFVLQEKLAFWNDGYFEQFEDSIGNVVHRWILQAGKTEVVHDAILNVPAVPDDANPKTYSVPVSQMSWAVLRYTLPSRYCDSDKLLSFSFENFGGFVTGVDRVIAICNWVQKNIRYVTLSGRSDLSASEVIARGYGVCRDFAHVAISLCRALNLPARYVTGHLPDIGCFDPGTPMDFHAYFEVYLEHQWRTFDARFNTPRIGRIKIAHGLDAVDGSFSTVYGPAVLTFFEVWSYQIDPNQVKVGDPVDLSKRLDGTPVLRFQ